MSRARRIVPGLAAAGIGLAGGCGRTTTLAPPELHLGEDPCAACGMIVSDERYAAASLAERGGEGIVALVFDDVGCVYIYERDHPEERIVRRYVHDHASVEWTDAAGAWYVHDASLRTPMLFGVACFAREEEARRFAQERGVEPFGETALRGRWAPGGEEAGGGGGAIER